MTFDPLLCDKLCAGLWVDHTVVFWHLIPLLASPGTWVEI